MVLTEKNILSKNHKHFVVEVVMKYTTCVGHFFLFLWTVSHRIVYG